MYLVDAARKYNGEIATKSGAEGFQDKKQSDLDRSRYGSKEGLLSKKKAG